MFGVKGFTVIGFRVQGFRMVPGRGFRGYSSRLRGSGCGG